MATPEQIEIYKQRYDTFRHLDRLRWQIFQIAIGVGTLTLAFARDSGKPDWWVFFNCWLHAVYIWVCDIANRAWNQKQQQDPTESSWCYR